MRYLKDTVESWFYLLYVIILDLYAFPASRASFQSQNLDFPRQRQQNLHTRQVRREDQQRSDFEQRNKEEDDETLDSDEEDDELQFQRWALEDRTANGLVPPPSNAAVRRRYFQQPTGAASPQAGSHSTGATRLQSSRSAAASTMHTNHNVVSQQSRKSQGGVAPRKQPLLGKMRK